MGVDRAKLSKFHSGVHNVQNPLLSYLAVSRTALFASPNVESTEHLCAPKAFVLSQYGYWSNKLPIGRDGR